MASIIWRVTKETKTPARVASFKTKGKHKGVMSFIFQIFHELHSTVPIPQGRLQRSRSQRTPSYLLHLWVHQSRNKNWVMLSISLSISPAMYFLTTKSEDLKPASGFYGIKKGGFNWRLKIIPNFSCQLSQFSLHFIFITAHKLISMFHC